MRERGRLPLPARSPFLYYYYIHLGRRDFPHFDASPDQPRSFDDIVDLIQGESRGAPGRCSSRTWPIT